MYLKITSPDKVIFSGQVQKVVIPTESGEIGILPGHNPLSGVVKPGLVKILPTKEEKDQINDDLFLFQDNNIFVSVSKGLLFVDGESIMIVTSAATTSPTQTQEVLEKMKKDLEDEIEKLRVKGSIEDLEKALINLQKVTADLKLYKIKGIVK